MDWPVASLRQYDAFFVTYMGSPGFHDLNVNGPVPIGLTLSLAFSCAGDATNPSWLAKITGKCAHGADIVTLTVAASTLEMSATIESAEPVTMLERTFSRCVFSASASIGVPSWK